MLAGKANTARHGAASVAPGTIGTVELGRLEHAARRERDHGAPQPVTAQVTENAIDGLGNAQLPGIIVRRRGAAAAAALDLFDLVDVGRRRGRATTDVLHGHPVAFPIVEIVDGAGRRGLILPALQAPGGIIAQELTGGTAARAGGGATGRATDHIARRVIGSAIAAAGGGDGMQMLAVPVAVGAQRPGGQPSVQVVAIVLLVLRTRQRARRQRATGRGASGPSPGELVLLVIAELLIVGACRQRGLYSRDVAHPIIARLRLEELQPVAGEGKCATGQPPDSIVPRIVGIHAVAQQHAGDVRGGPGGPIVVDGTGQGGRGAALSGGDLRKPALRISHLDHFPGRIGLACQMPGIIVGFLQRIAGAVDGGGQPDMLAALVVGIAVGAGEAAAARKGFPGLAPNAMVPIGDAIVAIAGLGSGGTVGGVAPQ